MAYNLTIEGHDLEVTPTLRQYVIRKLERPTRHFDQIVSVAVLMKCENTTEKDRQQKAEVTLRLKGKEIFIEKSDADLYAAIDKLMDCLDQQVRAYKRQVQRHRHVAPKRASAVLA